MHLLMDGTDLSAANGPMPTGCITYSRYSHVLGVAHCIEEIFINY